MASRGCGLTEGLNSTLPVPTVEAPCMVILYGAKRMQCFDIRVQFDTEVLSGCNLTPGLDYPAHI